MRALNAVVIVALLLSCSNKEPDSLESYRFMFGSVAADLCITSMHLLALNRRGVAQGTFTAHDRAVVVENEDALKRLQKSYEKSLETLYADEARRTRDATMAPLFARTIECSEAFLAWADSRLPEHEAKYLECQKQFTQSLPH